MRKTFGKLAGAVALAAIAVTGAAAQDAPRGKQAGDFVVGLGAIGVLPSNGGNTSIGGKPEASNSGTAQLDFTYFMLPQVALNLIAATSQHDVSAKGTALGDVKLGSVWVLPPTLTLQYHFAPTSRFSPYVGAGLNYTFFYNEKKGALRSISYDDNIGYALQAGIDYAIAGAWSFNIDVKKLWLNTDVKANLGGTALKADVDINPWIFGVGLGYRF
jgi:outer membrane protein